MIVSSAFAVQESQTFLTKCFNKEYASEKPIKKVTLAFYENLSGDTFGALEVEMNPKGLSAGVLTTTCQVDKTNYTCSNEKDGGKFTFNDEGQSGTLKIEEPLKVKIENQITPGKSSASRLPAGPPLKLQTAIPSACEKLVP